jgi:hypothetical protein
LYLVFLLFRFHINNYLQCKNINNSLIDNNLEQLVIHKVINISTLCKSVILRVFFKLFSLVIHCYSSNFN